MDTRNDAIATALRDAAVTRELVVAAGAIDDVPRVVANVLGNQRVTVVADENTHRAAGAAVARALVAAGLRVGDTRILREAPRVKPRAETARELAAELRAGGCAPIAVGSGVVNDLVKHAAALVERPYVCVPTAASMDGYAASGAALIDGKFKRTLPCPPPVGIVADLDVLATAPPDMASWGYGDLAGKFVAGADWTLADALDVEAINPRPFAMVQDHLTGWLAEPERLARRDREALGNLLTGLLVSGFAMQAHGNSRPASGSDHQFSHLWEMENLTVNGEPAAHGACVGVGCVAMLALYEWLVEQEIGADDIARARSLEWDADALEREIRAAFGDTPVAASARDEMTAKRAAGERAARLRRFEERWPVLRTNFGRLPRARDVQRQLRAAGGATHPSDLGIAMHRFAADHRRARLIRRRYTVLDLVEDLGWLDRAIDGLFAADGFWGRQPSPAPAVASAGGLRA